MQNSFSPTSRKLKKINYINYDYKSGIFTKIKKNFYSIFYSNVRVGFQFSLIGNKSFIPPHCDTVNKLLSLMIYFPETNVKADYNKLAYEYKFNDIDGGELNLSKFRNKVIIKGKLGNFLLEQIFFVATIKTS